VPRLRLQGTQAALPLPGTRRCEREPAEDSSQRPLSLAVSGGTYAHRVIRGHIHPGSGPPDADPEARLRSIKTAAIPATPDDHCIRRRKRVIGVRSRGLEAAQRRTCGLLECLVSGRPLVRPGLCPHQLRDYGPQPPDASAVRRRGPDQLLVVAAADKLNPALGAILQTAPVLPHCPAADAGRDRQVARLLHLVNITPCDLRILPGGSPFSCLSVRPGWR
jgi:hypothetical protein